jgi:hypothetical protein
LYSGARSLRALWSLGTSSQLFTATNNPPPSDHDEQRQQQQQLAVAEAVVDRELSELLAGTGWRIMLATSSSIFWTLVC